MAYIQTSSYPDSDHTTAQSLLFVQSCGFVAGNSYYILKLEISTTGVNFSYY